MKFQDAICQYEALLNTPVSPKPAILDRPLVRYSALAIGSITAAGIYYFTRPPEPPPQVSPPPKPPAPVAIEPTLQNWSPLETELSVFEGETQQFSVSAEGPPDATLRYEWLLDGEKQSDGPTWAYQPGFAEADGKPKELKVIITSKGQQAITHGWRIQVTNVNREPHIGTALPKSKAIELSLNDLQEFSIDALDPDSDDKLIYRWFLDGTEVSQGPRWRYQASAPEQPHKVSAKVMDPGGLASEITWQVNVKKPLLPPTIVRINPKPAPGETLTVRQGETQDFSAEARSAHGSALRYTWFLDGEKKGNGQKWVYQPGVSASANRPQEVKLVVTDADGRAVEIVWKIQTGTPNRAPRIVSSSPAANEAIRLETNGNQSFSVEAQDPDDNETLTYRWLFDGKQVNTSSHWHFHAHAAVGPHTVEVIVTDASGIRVTRSWVVTVEAPATPPTIVKAQPSSNKLTLREGEPLSFSVRGNTSSGTNDMRYQWTFDRDTPKTTETGEYSLKDTSIGKHNLSVVAIAPQGLTSKPRSWVIEILPAQLKPKPESPPLVIQESEVRAWLDSYQRAWQAKDIDALARLGEVSPNGRDNLRKVLSDYGDFRVSLEEIEIRAEGGEATVSFKRVDTIDGKTLPHPRRKQVVLQKLPSGGVSRR